MSDLKLKERVMKEFEQRYGDNYRIFNEYVENKIIENGGRYIMGKNEYYNYCNKVNEDNTVISYVKRTKCFTYTIEELYEKDEEIDCTGEFTASSCLKYCIERFADEHEDCEIYFSKDGKLYFKVKIDWLKGG